MINYYLYIFTLYICCVALERDICQVCCKILLKRKISHHNYAYAQSTRAASDSPLARILLATLRPTCAPRFHFLYACAEKTPILVSFSFLTLFGSVSVYRFVWGLVRNCININWYRVSFRLRLRSRCTRIKRSRTVSVRSFIQISSAVMAWLNHKQTNVLANLRIYNISSIVCSISRIVVLKNVYNKI